MSNRHSSWMTSSLPRPTALNSPSVGRLSDIKGRLSFSAMKTPAFKPKQRSLVEHARTSASPVNGYHMSKQNPDVLDRLCSPSPSHRDTLLHKKTLTPATVRVSAGGGVLIGARNGHQTPGQSSLVKQMLNDKHRAPTSLVHLATRGKAFRSGVNISPVVVKLSGAVTHNLPSNSSSLNSSREENGSAENHAEASLRPSSGEGSPGKSRDPCDKNVVLSALRQRRKRWATSPPDDDNDQSPSTSGSPFVGAPLAKRTKHSSQGSEAQPFKYKSPLSYILGDRKRAYTAPSYSMSPDSKKSRLGTEGDSEVAVPLSVRGKVSLPDFECDGESEVSEYSEAGEQESGTSSKTSSRAPSECIGGVESDGLQRRSLTPPVQFDEAEINRKREESLNNLKAVFSPKGGDKKSSNRRKLPIFCATGNKPHLPTPLSRTHTVTQEDLKKDREAAAAKLREILTAEDPLQTTDSTTSLASLPSQTTLSTAASSSKDMSNSLPGVRLSSSLSGSLPSLPSASATTKSGSSLSSAGGSLSLMMPKSTQSLTTSTPSSVPSLATSTSLSSSALPTSSLASVSTSITAPLTQPSQVKSVSFAPLPVPTPASTTQANFAFPTLLPNSSQVAPAIQPATTRTFTLSSTAAQSQAGGSLGLTLSTSTAASTKTGLQLPQFPSTLAATTTAAGNTLSLNSTNATLQVSKASIDGGLAQGISFPQQQQLSAGLSLAGNSGAQLSLFQNSSNSIPSMTATAALAQGGSIFNGANSTASAPSTSTSGGFTFALPSTTQQQQAQQSNSLFQATKPALSAASSSATTNSVFSLNSGQQMPATSQLQTSSTGTGGLGFQVQPQQQQQSNPMSIFGGVQTQNSQNSGGIAFNFSQPPTNNGSGLAASSSAGLNFTAGTQQSQATGGNGLKSSTFNFSAGLTNSAQQQTVSGGSGGLNFNPGGSQSSGGLSLFNNPGNIQQPQQNQPSIFSAGAGGVGAAANTQKPGQSSSTSGLFNNQQQSTSTGFPGFKFSAGTTNSQPQQGSQFVTNTLTGGNTGGLKFSAGQGGGGASSGFPSFNAGSQMSGSSSGFNFSAGTANTGGVGVGRGLFQNVGSTPSQTSNPLATGNQTQKSGINFNFSASGMGTQQGAQQQQQTQGQSQGGLFSFGQKSNSTSGFNFAGNGNTGLGLGTQSQNGNSGFNFNAGMGMNSGGGGGGGGAGTSGGVFNNNSSSNIFQNQIQQQPSANIFQTPQPQKQPSFTTPTNQPSIPGQGGFSFSATPSAAGFSTGTPGGSGRPVARARRRKK